MTAHLVRLQNTIARRDQRGAALAEYGLLLALVALVAMGIMATFGETLAETFGFARDTFNESPAGAGNGT